MTTVTIRDLRYDFPKVEELLRQGHEVQITRRGKPIARLVPEKPERPPFPDFLGRIRAIYGDREFDVSGADLLSAERDRL